ncbi:MAG TPA: hypothetical protein VNF71_09220 [Acidimicrobiales bacterium]|nr:hypothetical protein [Acidimicrobiales bacterium]
MSSDRYVVLGLAPVRSQWFDAVSQWSNSAALAAEFVKCVSAEEVRARLGSGRLHSALVVDATLPSLDRDLVHAAGAAGTPVIVVRDTRRGGPSAADLGAAAELPADFDRDQLLDTLAAHCRAVGAGDRLPPALTDAPSPLWLAEMVTVCGPGGTGASTAAMALAQGMASDARNARRVLLADLARHADQAMLHNATDLGPGIQELVEACRLSEIEPSEVRGMTFEVPRRGYQLLLGLRRPEAWSALRPRAVDAAIRGLRRSFQAVVCDVEGDFEGETEGGSADVEERNHLARSAALHSTVVVAVGAPGMKGVHSLARLARSLIAAGVRTERILPVINRAPRSPRARAEMSRAFASLTDVGSTAENLSLANLMPLPERKLEECLRDSTAMPSALVDPLHRAVSALCERLADTAPAEPVPARIAPGSLGHWPEASEFETGNA